MPQITPLVVLNTLIRHETLTLNDLAQEKNIGIVTHPGDLQVVLKELNDQGLVKKLDNVSPVTYTITSRGIVEGKKLNSKCEV